jgi:hypothetical protein
MGPPLRAVLGQPALVPALLPPAVSLPVVPALRGLPLRLSLGLLLPAVVLLPVVLPSALLHRGFLFDDLLPAPLLYHGLLPDDLLPHGNVLPPGHLLSAGDVLPPGHLLPSDDLLSPGDVLPSGVSDDHLPDDDLPADGVPHPRLPDHRLSGHGLPSLEQDQGTCFRRTEWHSVRPTPDGVPLRPTKRIDLPCGCTRPDRFFFF